jgi:hypothetical protein
VLAARPRALASPALPVLGTELGVPIDGGRFYPEETSAAFPITGYSVTGPMWQVYEQVGREFAWGPPVSRRYRDGQRRLSQAFEYCLLRLTMNDQTEVVGVEWYPIMDTLGRQGKNTWLRDTHQIARPQAGADHVAILDRNPLIQAVYLDDPDAATKHGTAVGYEEFGAVNTMRFQHAAFYHFVDTGQVELAPAGRIAKEASGLVPDVALPVETLEVRPRVTQERPRLFPSEIDFGGGSVLYNLDDRYGMAPSPNTNAWPPGTTQDQARQLSVDYMIEIFQRYARGRVLEQSIGRNLPEDLQIQRGIPQHMVVYGNMID